MNTTYVVYNQNTMSVCKTYQKESTAKRITTRLNNVWGNETYAYCTRDEHTNRVPMVTRVNLMSGKEYQERMDTPLHMSPSSETYWSM